MGRGLQGRAKQVRLGGGSACPGERLEPAVELVEKGNIDYIIFDSLSESEMLAFERQKMSQPDAGYDIYSERRLRAIWPQCARSGIRIIGNMGAANPRGGPGSRDTRCPRSGPARAEGCSGVGGQCTCIDDQAEPGRQRDREHGQRVWRQADRRTRLHSCRPIVEALEQDADLVITGRVGDASLFLGPMIHEFGWRADAWDLLAKGIVLGHLLECAGHVTGGYFADPPYKTVPDLYRLGFPIAEITAEGETIITKTPGSGGVVEYGHLR